MLVAGLALHVGKGEIVKTQTEIGVVGLIKSVVVSDGAPCIKAPTGPISNTVKVILSERLRCVDYYSSRVKSSRVDGNWIGADRRFLSWIGKIFGKRMGQDAYPGPVNRSVGRSLSEITRRQMDDRFGGWRKIIDNLIVGGRDKADVSTELSFSVSLATSIC